MKIIVTFKVLNLLSDVSKFPEFLHQNSVLVPRKASKGPELFALFPESFNPSKSSSWLLSVWRIVKAPEESPIKLQEVKRGRVEGVGGRAHGGSNDVGGWRTGGEDGNRGAAGGRGVWRLDRSYNIA